MRCSRVELEVNSTRFCSAKVAVLGSNGFAWRSEPHFMQLTATAMESHATRGHSVGQIQPKKKIKLKKEKSQLECNY